MVLFGDKKSFAPHLLQAVVLQPITNDEFLMLGWINMDQRKHSHDCITPK